MKTTFIKAAIVLTLSAGWQQAHAQYASSRPLSDFVSKEDKDKAMAVRNNRPQAYRLQTNSTVQLQQSLPSNNPLPKQVQIANSRQGRPAAFSTTARRSNTVDVNRLPSQATPDVKILAEQYKRKYGIRRN